jgi:hypothetical protein
VQYRKPHLCTPVLGAGVSLSHLISGDLLPAFHSLPSAHPYSPILQ